MDLLSHVETSNWRAFRDALQTLPNGSVPGHTLVRIFAAVTCLGGRRTQFCDVIVDRVSVFDVVYQDVDAIISMLSGKGICDDVVSFLMGGRMDFRSAQEQYRAERKGLPECSKSAELRIADRTPTSLLAPQAPRGLPHALRDNDMTMAERRDILMDWVTCKALQPTDSHVSVLQWEDFMDLLICIDPPEERHGMLAQWLLCNMAELSDETWFDVLDCVRTL